MADMHSAKAVLRKSRERSSLISPAGSPLEVLGHLLRAQAGARLGSAALSRRKRCNVALFLRAPFGLGPCPIVRTGDDSRLLLRAA